MSQVKKTTVTRGRSNGPRRASKGKKSPNLIVLVLKKLSHSFKVAQYIPGDVAAVIILAVSVFLTLALLNVPTGPGGKVLATGLRVICGWSWPLVVGYLITTAVILLIIEEKKNIFIKTACAFWLLVISFSALLDQIGGHLSFSSGSEKIEKAGGYLGVLFARPVNYLFGGIGLYLIYVAFFIAGFLLIGSEDFKRIGKMLIVHLTKDKRDFKKEKGIKESQSFNATKQVSETEALKAPEFSEEPPEDLHLGSDLIVDSDNSGQPDKKTELLEKEAVNKESISQLKLPFDTNNQSGKNWKRPSVSLLIRSKSVKDLNENASQQGRQLVETLESHGVKTKLAGFSVGPTVTRYELELASGVKVNRVLGLSKDIAYAMAAADVRILAPIPGKSAIGVEVPNKKRQLVTLGDVFVSSAVKRNDHPLAVPFGKDISGQTYVVNLTEMPHLLIAGATGSGKSSCINSIICSLLLKDTPDELRLILIDPKRVELGAYSKIPHLLTDVVVDPKKAAKALNWAVKEMEKRYEMLSEVGAKDIRDYNSIVSYARQEDPESELVPLYYIVVIVDELNDLMMVAPREVEDAICRIAQMARAVGIHLVIATQRPSVDVITGVIKANIPSRLAFSVSSLADSRVILDQAGAERLIGKGDMLLMTASSSNPIRLQAPWISQNEISLIVAFWRRQEASFASAISYDLENRDTVIEEDELTQAAMDLVIEAQQGSTTMLQRKLRIGFARAGRLMDILEQKGVVSPPDGSRARKVLITKEEYEEIKKRRAT